ncbi:protein trichome birefringence-like 19 [Musa acuminata AAA Group]|uniref:protein trichome birefringence-like 19 n=1 Tax=Musa acuminata AAA Group TaxID=214697 RepID=UPI0031D4479E
MTTQMTPFDYDIVSAGHWFFRPTMFFEAGQLVGCHYCLHPNVTDLTMYYSYRRAFGAALRAFNDLPGFRGTVFLRTFAPSHFENGEWNKGGNCVRRRPFRGNETRMDGYNLEMYMAQLEEYRAAEGEGREKGVRFRLLDTTEAMLLRPDGHPGRFGHRPDENVTLYNDCVHWCLPGPIDAWNDFLLHMLKNEGGRSATGRRSRNDRKSTIK